MGQFSDKELNIHRHLVCETGLDDAQSAVNLVQELKCSGSNKVQM